MRIDFTPRPRIRLDFTPRVFLKSRTHSYLLIRKGRAYGYFLTIEGGAVEVVKVPWNEERGCYTVVKRNEGEVRDKEQRILSWDLEPYNYSFEKALGIYRRSTLEKTVKADREIRVLEGTYEQPAIVPHQSEALESPKGSFSLTELCTELGIDPGAARRTLRGRVDRPGGKWEWPTRSAANQVIAILLEAKSR